MAILPGKRLGPHEMLSSVGAGGMGEVYRARDTRLKRILAGKGSLRTTLIEVESEMGQYSGSVRSAKRERRDS